MERVDYFIENMKAPYFYDSLKPLFESIYFEQLSLSKKILFLKKYFKLPAQGIRTINYWLARGYDKFEGKEKIAEYNNKKPIKRLSPFTKEFWINKGYSEQDAIFKSHSCRPIFKEFWINKGYSEQDAIIKALEAKENNNKTGAKSSSKRNIKDIRNVSPRCIEYWLRKTNGDIIQAKKLLKQSQTTFSIETCIEKYGEDTGYKIWKTRQDKWQNTINKKDNIKTINNSKRFIKYSDLIKFNNKDDAFNFIKKHSQVKNIFKTIDEAIDFIFKEPSSYYKSFNNILKKTLYIQKIWFIYINCYNDYIKKVKIILKEHSQKVFKQTYGIYNCYIDEGLLKSSYEIYFYNKIKNMCSNISVNKPYPEKLNNITRYYDFLIDNKIYIEIAPKYYCDEAYRKLIDEKEKNYKCIVLKTKSEINKFIKQYKEAKNG